MLVTSRVVLLLDNVIIRVMHDWCMIFVRGHSYNTWLFFWEILIPSLAPRGQTWLFGQTVLETTWSFQHPPSIVCRHVNTCIYSKLRIFWSMWPRGNFVPPQSTHVHSWSFRVCTSSPSLTPWCGCPLIHLWRSIYLIVHVVQSQQEILGIQGISKIHPYTLTAKTHLFPLNPKCTYTP